MNPKEMTNEQLAEYPRDFTSQDLLSATVEDIQNQPFSSRCKAECDELLRRLNEADALRRENEELAMQLHYAVSSIKSCYGNGTLAVKHMEALLSRRAARLAKESEANDDR